MLTICQGSNLFTKWLQNTRLLTVSIPWVHNVTPFKRYHYTWTFLCCTAIQLVTLPTPNPMNRARGCILFLRYSMIWVIGLAISNINGGEGVSRHHLYVHSGVGKKWKFYWIVSCENKNALTPTRQTPNCKVTISTVETKDQFRKVTIVTKL